MQADLERFCPPRDRQYVSVGSVCGLLQLMPAELAVLMDGAQVRFALVLDGCGYLSISDAELVANAAGTFTKRSAP